MRRPALRAALPLALVAVVAGAATVSSLSGRDGEPVPPPPPPPESTEAATTVDPLGSLRDPPPGVERPAAPAAGRYAGFVLAAETGTCSVAGWNLARGEATGSSGRACAFALSPGADWVVLTDDAAASLADATLDRIGFEDDDYRQRVIRTGPASLGEVALADDGSVATCTAAGGRQRTIVVDAAGARRDVAGCSPVAIGERVLVARSEGAVVVADAQGRAVVRRDDLARPPIGTVVIGAASDGLLAVVARRAPDEVAVDVLRLPDDEAGRPAAVASVPLPARDPTTLRLAPGGRAAAFREVGSRGWTLVAWPTGAGAPATLPAIDGYGPVLDVAFSPDGGAAVVGTPRAVLVIDLPGLTTAATVPIDGGAASVEWLSARG